MALEIRHITEEELEAFNRNVRIAFAAEGSNFEVKVPVEWTLCAFEDGKLSTSYMSWPLTMYFDNASFPVAGVSMVGTLPVYRRKGHLRKITQKHFETLYETGGEAISALFASMAAIYQRFGYGIVSSKYAYTVEPRRIQFAVDCKVRGSFYEADDSEAGTILKIYHKFAMPRVGFLQRDEAMAVAPGHMMTPLNMPPVPVPVMKVIYQENGEPQGYMVYSVVRGATPALGQHMDLRDLAWLTPQAYRAMWDYLANMDLVDDIVWGRVPPDDPLPHLLLEPRRITPVRSDGLLARLIDVRRALTLRTYRKEAELTFKIIDGFCPWNEGRWKLGLSPDGANVKQTDESPQLTMPVTTLAMLMFGQISATEAARMARLDVHDTDALEIWDNAMRTPYQPYCADMF